MILTLIYLLLTPLGVMLLAKRWKWIEKVSPMTVLYAIGLMVANFLPVKVDAEVNTWASNIAIPLAIPLMLMGCDTTRWQLGKALKVFLTGLGSVLLVTVAGFFLFKPSGAESHEAFAKVCAVATGIYTGGIPNMGAISKAVGMNAETYLYITSYDLIVTGIYLVFIIFFGRPLFRKLLPNADNKEVAPQPEKELPERSRQEKRKSLLLTILLTIVIAALSYGAALLCTHEGAELNMTILILTLTTLSIGASFLPPIKRQEESFDLGLYCVYFFCLSIATACDVRTMDITGSLPILYYLAFIVFGSVTLQILLARILHIDGDSVMVSSVALVNSPPFVPLAAALLGNKNVIVLGITIGLLGYMLGNYLGIGLYHLLLML